MSTGKRGRKPKAAQETSQNTKITEFFYKSPNSNASPTKNHLKSPIKDPILLANDDTGNVLNDSTNLIVTTPKSNREDDEYGKRKSGQLSSPLKENNKKSRVFPKAEDILNVSCELFDQFVDEWNEVYEKSSQYSLDLNRWQHCIVKAIVEKKDCKIITLQCTENEEEKTQVTLLGAWRHCKLDVGCIVYVTAVPSKCHPTPFQLDDECGGYLVYEPEMLISGTTVVSALFCKRRAVLHMNIKSTETTGCKVMLIGSLVHQVFQICLRDKLNQEHYILEVIERLFSDKDLIFQMYSNDMSYDETKRDVTNYVPKIMQFMNQYVNCPSSSKTVHKLPTADSIDEIQDIEENIWCHKFGIKGKVDVSVRTGPNVIPLEVKTGRVSGSLEHRGQVMLYAMMMRQLGYKTPSGLLLYIKENNLQTVSGGYKEERDLVLLRNDLVYFLKKQSAIRKTSYGDATAATTDKDKDGDLMENLGKDFEEKLKLMLPELPEPINHHRACSTCPYNTVCCALLDKDPPMNNPLTLVKKEKLEHLSQEHLKYFSKWYTLIYLEEDYKSGKVKNLKDIYTKTPQEREKLGRSLIHMKLIDGGSAVTKADDNYVHRFCKKSAGKDQQDLSNYGIIEGNYLVVSTDSRPAVAAGYVTALTPETVSVALERNLEDRYRDATFHLDTYESSMNLVFNLSNLTMLLENSEPAARLRRTMIDGAPPAFTSTLPKVVGQLGVQIMKGLNKVQMNAVLKALSAKDYLLIKGMPGTGKTQTMVCLVRMFVALNLSVLVTSHTHSAVDNVCLRLDREKVEFLRLGNLSRINARLHHRCEQTVTRDYRKPEQFQELYEKAPVVAVTCMGSNHVALSKRQFDVCIIDESTQVLQSTVIRPLLASKRFILIGDPDQLAPVIRNPQAVKMGMNVSLFAKLQSPVSVYTLTHQYRMNRCITNLANALTYGGQLIAANDTVAGSVIRKLEAEKLMEAELGSVERATLGKVLNCELDASVVFIDTGSVWNRTGLDDFTTGLVQSSLRPEDQGGCYNVHEAALADLVCKALLRCEIAATSIGVMATYLAQVELLKKLLSKWSVDVNTVDQYQGRDKDIIIYSCTKSLRTSINEFDVLEDKRRLTVAITRAKLKLILIGDKECLVKYTPFKRLIENVRSQNVNKGSGKVEHETNSVNAKEKMQQSCEEGKTHKR